MHDELLTHMTCTKAKSKFVELKTSFKKPSITNIERVGDMFFTA